MMVLVLVDLLLVVLETLTVRFCCLMSNAFLAIEFVFVVEIMCQ